jgi:hypothetical protein
MHALKKVRVFFILALLLGGSLIFFTVKQQTDNRSKASISPSQEAESGQISGAANVGSDSTASGGKYVLFGQVISPTTAPNPPATPLSLGNKFGMHVISMLPSENNQLIWSKTLIGSGGFIKSYWPDITPGTSGPPNEMVQFVNFAYTNNLIPVVRIDGYWADKNKCGAGLTFTCEALAAKFKTIVSALPRKDGTPLWIEVMNENNFDSGWGGHASGAEYGQALLLIANALHSIGDSRIKVVNGGLADDWGIPTYGAGVKATQFIKDMFNSNPTLKTGNKGRPVIDAWASHPYPGSTPPTTNTHSGAGAETSTYDWYINELNILSTLGITNLPVLITETGYTAPPFSQDQKASNTVEAMKYWNSDSRVLGFMPFVMSDFPLGDAHGKFFSEYFFVPYTSGTNTDGTPTSPYAVYTAVRNYRISAGK